MDTSLRLIPTSLLAIASALVALSSIGLASDEAARPIPFDQLGAEAGKDYKGDGLAITPSDGGASLRCDFQKLRGNLTCEGLWLEDTGQESPGVSFRIVARSFGRDTLKVLPSTGEVETEPSLARFIRPGVVEEYSVSMDGVRQDFLINEKPAGSGQLRMELAVDGAQTEACDKGANLILKGSGRVLAYHRLHVTDAVGRTLTARMEVVSNARLSLLVDDSDATYPIRVDPTFSDADWVSMNPSVPGTNIINSFTTGIIRAIAVDDTGNIYIGGSFELAGNVLANNIAKWNGSVWSTLGIGVNHEVNALVVNGADLYVGGRFTSAGGVSALRIAKWNGISWTGLGTGMDSSVYALVGSGSDLYAGGSFTTAGGVTVNRIAKWNGSAWSALSGGMTSGNVNTLAMNSGNLYAGGDFTAAGSVANTRYIARWSGGSWSSLGTGMNGSVYALATSGNNVYAGGDFTTAGGVAANRIAKWNGSIWSALGTGANGRVSALAVQGGLLYAGGSFTFMNLVSANRIAQWDGSTWSSLGAGLPDSSSVSAILATATEIFIGGGFTQASGLPACNVAKWNGSAWGALGTGINGSVSALAVNGRALYVGGEFTTVGGLVVNYVAKWNGSGWSSLGSGLNGAVNSLAFSGDVLYAGGAFTTAGGGPASNIAKWDGNSWSALGSGINSSVRCLAASGGDLYAGGYFTIAGGISANNIAKWNGSTWSPLGSGTGSDGVSHLAVMNSYLYVGGNFISAGGLAGTTGIARWDGSSWSSVGGGISGSVAGFASSGSDLYVASENSVRKWNGSTWAAGTFFYAGPYGSVTAVATVGNDVYVSGNFNTAAGAVGNRIAKWDGSTWSPLGSGINDVVRKMVADDSNHLFLCGRFTSAGTTVSPYLVQVNIPSSLPSTSNPTRTNIGSSVATLGGNVTNQGDSPITQRGIVYSASNANDNPLIGGSGVSTMTVAGTTGVFEATADGLLPGISYTFKAYATNALGTAYSYPSEFTTLGNYIVSFNLGSNGTRSGGGTLVQTIVYGGAAQAPVVTPNPGWSFTGWDLPYDNITGNLTLTGIYAPATYTVTFDLGGKGVRAGGGNLTQMVTHGNAAVAPTVQANMNWNFTGWDTTFDNVTNNFAVMAVYQNVTLYTVTFSLGLNGSATRVGGGELIQSVVHGGSAIAPQISSNSGQSFVGWDQPFNFIVSNLTITATYAPPPSLTVTFDPGTKGSRSGGGALNQSVTYLDAAEAPLITASLGWTFVGWDLPFASVTGDMLIRAIYEPTAYTDTFDPAASSALWAVFEGEVAANTYGQSAGTGSSGNSLWFNGNLVRSATTVPLDLTASTVIRFKIALGNDSAQNWENVEEGDGEGIVVEYTVDGVSFTTLGGPFINKTWVEFSFSLPQAAKTNTTRFRFRQLLHSGANYDNWAIDDLFIDHSQPSGGNTAPTAVASATVVNAAIGAVELNGLLSSDPDGTISSYTWTWSGGSTTGISPSVTLSGGATTITLTVTDNLGATGTATVTVHVNDIGSILLQAGLSGSTAALNATPFNDGVSNLLKYAFNMNAAGPDVSTLTTGGAAGLPQIAVDTSGAEPVLRVAFLRRKGSGLIYTPQRSDTLGTFVAMTGTQTVTSIDAQWERVAIEEPAPPATAPSAFARVQVSLP